MDFIEPLDDNYSSEFNLPTEIIAYLRETAKWAKFISIVGFVFVGLMIMGTIGVSVFMGSLGSELGDMGMMPFPPMFIALFYLIMALIMLMPILYLYKFASNMQLALNNNDKLALIDSFKNLKSHYKFYGILLAIMLGFYALIFVFGILGGLSSFL